MAGARALIIDSDPAHRVRIEVPLAEAGYSVDSITHESAVAHISREDMSRYGAVIVAMSDEPSTLSSTYRLGEYVLHYIGQLCPDVLPRVVIVTAVAQPARTASPLSHVVIEPATPEQLLAAVRAACGDSEKS